VDGVAGAPGVVPRILSPAAFPLAIASDDDAAEAVERRTKCIPAG